MAGGGFRYRLDRSRRIAHSKDFSRLQRTGKRWVARRFIVNWADRDDASSVSRVGVVASKRSVGNAVQRARARRLLREVFRLNQHRLTHPIDVVLVARRSLMRAEFGELQRDFLEACRRVGLMSSEQRNS